jgi:hypothetical protein
LHERLFLRRDGVEFLLADVLSALRGIRLLLTSNKTCDSTNDRAA